MKWLVAIALLAACEKPSIHDAPPTAWTMGPSLPLARLEPGVTALGQRLVVLGGFAPSGGGGGIDVTTEVDVLDVATGTWTQLPDAPVKRHHVQLATIGTTLFLLGGLDVPDASNNYPARGDCYALDTLDAAPAWRSLASMPAGDERGSAGVVVVPPRIYLLGGASTTAALASNIYYDQSIDQWMPALVDLPAPRSHPAAMYRVDGTFVVAGGLGGLFADSAAPDTWQLPAGAMQWTTDMPMLIGRGGCAYGMLAGQLVCAGGEAGTSALNSTESYDPFADAWTDEPMMPASTAGTQGAAIGERLFVPGGSRTLPTVTTGFAPTDTLYIFSPLNM